MRIKPPDGAVKAEFPAKLKPLFQPSRYKVLHGGRGGGKSWAIARALLIQAAQAPLRILCTREVQKSIKDSVHRLLSDQVESLGLGGFFEVLQTEIRGINGSLFLFAGLSDQTVDSVKSFEGVDRVWVEEAHSITQRSMNILTPTIRKDRSEIWLSLNPELETDPVYSRYVANPPPDSIVLQMNYRDNPWFPEVLEQERTHAQLTMSKEDYEHIWEGMCRPAVSGAIYADEVAAAIRDGRVSTVPYDPRLKVHTVWDMGWNDAMTIIMAQRLRSEIRIVGYVEESHKTLDWYAAKLASKPYNWGYDFLPHDAYHADYKTGKTAAQILKAFGRRPKPTPNVTREEGIRTARMLFPNCVFDKKNTERLLECLKRYRRSLNERTQEPGLPLHDAFSHGADAFRYLALVADKMTNEADKMDILTKPMAVLDPVVGY